MSLLVPKEEQQEKTQAPSQEKAQDSPEEKAHEDESISLFLQTSLGEEEVAVKGNVESKPTTDGGADTHGAVAHDQIARLKAMRSLLVANKSRFSDPFGPAIKMAKTANSETGGRV